MNLRTKINNTWQDLRVGRFAIFITIVALYITAAGVFGRLSVLVWLIVAMFATGFLMILILTRFRKFLVSTAYQFIFGAKLVAFILCTAGVYLVIWPFPTRIPIVSRLWFSLLALCFILSDVGYYLYSRDVNDAWRSLNEALRQAEENLAEKGSTDDRLDLLTEQVEAVAASSFKAEITAAKVAADLKESQGRADEVVGPAGKAADAAAKSGAPPEKGLKKR